MKEVCEWLQVEGAQVASPRLKSNLDGAGLGNHAAERRKQLTNSRGGEKLWDETGVALWVPREHGRELRR